MKRALPAFVLIAWPAAAEACAVCFSAADQNRAAFLVTTIVLSLLPLGLIGGGLLWLRRQARRLAGEADGETPVAAPRATRSPRVIEAPARERA